MTGLFKLTSDGTGTFSTTVEGYLGGERRPQILKLSKISSANRQYSQPSSKVERIIQSAGPNLSLSVPHLSVLCAPDRSPPFVGSIAGEVARTDEPYLAEQGSTKCMVLRAAAQVLQPIIALYVSSRICLEQFQPILQPSSLPAASSLDQQPYDYYQW